MTQLRSDPVKAQDALSTGWAQSPPCRLLTGSPAPPPPTLGKHSKGQTLEGSQDFCLVLSDFRNPLFRLTRQPLLAGKEENKFTSGFFLNMRDRGRENLKPTSSLVWSPPPPQNPGIPT